MSEYSALQNSFDQIQEQLARSVVGQEEVVEQLMIVLLAGGHCQFEGAPGAARALTVAKLAAALGLTFSRICCSSELLPEDLVGAADDAADSASLDDSSTELIGGPLFANIIFLDDASRLAPKTAAVIQQAVLNTEVIIGSYRYLLADPHVVLAATYTDHDPPTTAEPRDDRYLMKISVRFPSYQDEYRIVETASGPEGACVAAVLNAEQLLEMRRQVREVVVPPYVIHYALRLVRATRVHEGETADFIYEWVQAGLERALLTL